MISKKYLTADAFLASPSDRLKAKSDKWDIQMRLASSRTTKDVDLDLRERKIISANPELRNTVFVCNTFS